MGSFGSSVGIEKGVRLVLYAPDKNIFIANTFSMKTSDKKWTCEAPNAVTTTRNEIDFITTNKVRIIKDLSVVKKFQI